MFGRKCNCESLECSDFDFCDRIEHKKTAMGAKFNFKTHLKHTFLVFEPFRAILAFMFSTVHPLNSKCYTEKEKIKFSPYLRKFRGIGYKVIYD
jgi:hypothetical protein